MKEKSFDSSVEIANGGNGAFAANGGNGVDLSNGGNGVDLSGNPVDPIIDL